MAQRWKDKLRPASFRGIAFFVDTASLESGRRGPMHEFPDRDVPYREDTGRRARRYDVEGYLVGSEYLAAKRTLIDACEKAGSGDLVHPYYGRVRVVCDGVTVQETSGSGGFVKFSFKFVEAGQLSFPKQGADSQYLIDQATDALKEANSGAFAERFSVLNQASFVIDSAAEKVEAFADEVGALTSGVSGTAASLSELAFSIRNLKANVRDLVNTPALLAQQMDSALGFLSDALDPSDVLDACKKLFGFGDEDEEIPLTTSTREQQDKNRKALNTLVQVIAIGDAASAAAGMDHVSVDDATAVRDALNDQLDSLMEETDDDETFSKLQALRAEIANAIPGKDKDLAQIATLTLPGSLPSIVLAYELYGHLDLEQDLIDRNNVRHPGFVPGGQELEVLDRG